MKIADKVRVAGVKGENVAKIMEISLWAGNGDPSMAEQGSGELSFFTCKSVRDVCVVLWCCPVLIPLLVINYTQ